MLTTIRNFAMAGATAALIANLSTAVNAADELIISTATPPQHQQTLTMKWFADALEERSNGELKTKIFDSSQL